MAKLFVHFYQHQLTRMSSSGIPRELANHIFETLTNSEANCIVQHVFRCKLSCPNS